MIIQREVSSRAMIIQREVRVDRVEQICAASHEVRGARGEL